MFFRYSPVPRNLQKFIIFLLFGFFISPDFISATTIIPMVNSGGYFTGDVVWTKAGSPYVVTEAVFSGSSSLTIEPGTIVKLNQGYGILVLGRLKVGSATSTEKVYFTSIKDDTVGGDTNNDGLNTVPQIWDGAGLSFSGYGSIDNAVFRYGSSGGISAGKLVIFGGQLSLSRVSIGDSNNVALLQTAGNVSIINSEISNRCGGIRFSGGTLDITKSNLAIDYSLPTGQCSIFTSPRYVIDSRTVTPFFATNNWWGSPSGPKHQLNPSGTGSAILGNVDFTPWLTSNPLDVTTCTKDCFSNVLFLPGMMGSRLFEETDSLLNSEKERWVSNSDSEHERLALDSAGKSVYPLYTKQGEKGAVDDISGFNVYQSFINDLERWKSKDGIIEDYSIVPYDWRLSLDDIMSSGKVIDGGISYTQATSSPYLIQELSRLAASSRTGKVTIVAHSNGGLVAKALIQKLRDSGDPLADKIDDVVFVAVPQTGTPDGVGALLHGVKVGPSGFLMRKERVRNLLHNMPVGYNLLPSRAFIESLTEPLIEFTGGVISPAISARYGAGINSYAEFTDYILGREGRTAPEYADLNSPAVLSPTLFSSAEAVHATLDQWAPFASTTVYEVAGWGLYTPAGLRYKKNKVCIPAEQTSTPPVFGIPQPIRCAEYRDTIKIYDKLTLGGDDTVVEKSAQAMPSSANMKKYWVNLEEYNKSGLGSTIDREHKDIFEVDTLRPFIRSIITKNILPQPSSITADRSALVADTSYTKYEVHSPLNIHIYDQAGNHTGISTSTGFLEKGVKGSAYFELGESKILIVPANTPHTLKLDAYAAGSFTLDIETLLGDMVTASTTFEAIPTATTTQATFVWNPQVGISSSTILKIDFNADNVIDIALPSTVNGTTVYDITPPEAMFYFSTTTQEVIISGIDAGGAVGVVSTATSTTLTDQAGNSTIIHFSKLKEKSNKTKVIFDAIIYNGIATSTPKTTIEYEWEFKNDGTLKELSQDVRIKKTRRVSAEYKAKKDETKIVDKVKEDGEESITKIVKLGLAPLVVSTLDGVVGVQY